MRTPRALLALAPLAFAGCFASRPQSPFLIETQQAFDARRYDDVVKRLADQGLRSMRQRELARGYELLGQSQERLGRTAEALRTYQTGVALHPKDVNLLTHLANLLHGVGLNGEARPYYERILELSPNNAAAHLGLAETERRLGFLDRAALHFERTLESWGDQASIWRDYAEVLSDARRYPKALEAIERSLKLAESSATRLQHARILWRLERKAEGFAALAKAEALDPSNVALLHQRALWRLEAGELGEAELAATAVLESAPDDPLALWLRGSALIRRGRPDEARADLERAARQRKAPFVAAAAEGLLKGLR